MIKHKEKLMTQQYNLDQWVEKLLMLFKNTLKMLRWVVIYKCVLRVYHIYENKLMHCVVPTSDTTICLFNNRINCVIYYDLLY